MKKSALSYTELILVLLVVGLISVLTTQAYKTIKTKFSFSCYYLYRDLRIAIGHMTSDSVDGSLGSVTCDKDNLSSSDYQACINAAVSNSDNSNKINYATDDGFCKALAKYLSAASKVECTSTDMNNATLSNVYGSLTKPNFKLLNKNYVYVSTRVAGAETEGSLHSYRIVSFDLNGRYSPNKTGEDIISFAIFDNGEILPVGEPANNPNFFMTAIKMRTTSDRYSAENTSENIAKLKREVKHPIAYTINPTTKKPITFKEAYCSVVKQTTNDPNYCTGISILSIPLVQAYCVNRSLQTEDSKGKEPECEFNVIKPQISKFFPSLKDAYSSINNDDDIDEDSGKINQIYKY